MLNENYAEKSGKYKQIAGLSVDNIAESGIIKPITVEDITAVDKDGTISDECKNSIDKLFENVTNTVCNSLEDAVIHEIGHAKTIYSRTYANYEILNLFMILMCLN